MAFVYKNPLSSSQLSGVESVSRDKTYGTNFSVLQTGGYMEVYQLSDLVFTIPSSYFTDGGDVEFTGNTIPIQFNVGPSALPFIPDTLTLNSDGISSGRRRLGMLVYVHETEQTYQYTISNFETLFNNAENAGAITSNTYGYQVTDSTSEGKALIDVWTGSTIEGVSGVTRENARWRVFYGTDITVTGGTYSNGTATFTNSTGGTFNVTGFTSGGGSDTTITGGTYTLSTATIGLNDSTGGTTNIVGVTGQNFANTDLTLDDSRVISLDGNDLEIIGGTGEAFLLSSTDLVLSASTGGGTVSIKGISSSSETRALVINTNGVISYNDSFSGGDIAISGITYDGEWGITKNSTDGSSSTTLLPFITGGTISGGELNFDVAGGLEGVSIAFPESSDTYLTGGTITYNGTGDLDLSLNNSTSVTVVGLSKITGATLVGSTLTLTDNLGDDVSVSGFTTTTSDTFVTGGTYTESTGILTLDRNDGSDFGISGFEYIKSLSLNNNNLGITPNIGSPILGTVNAITDIGYNGDWALSGTSTGVFYTGTELPFITGGTYSSGTITLGINNGLESNISISGLDSDDTYLTGATYSPTTLTLGMNDGSEFTVGGFAPEITGGTYNDGTLSLLDNTGGSVNITGITFSSTNIYNTDGQLEGNRVIDQNSNSLTFSGGSVSMGTNTTNPVCALLEMASTTQGLLIPRMTQVQRLAVDTPLPGLLVYCTDTDGNGEEGMYMYKSVGWVNVL